MLYDMNESEVISSPEDVVLVTGTPSYVTVDPTLTVSTTVLEPADYRSI